MASKRFQECNWLEKVWRYRFYVYIPFKWFYFMYIKPFVVRETTLNEEEGYIEDTDKTWYPKGKELWHILVGSAQCDMNWTYTMEEVFGRIKEKHNIDE